MGKGPRPNKFYCGDNLELLRMYADTESVDLIYLDPPFQSGKDYNLLFARQDDGTRAPAQLRAFEDTWEWNEAASASYDELLTTSRPIALAIEAMRKFLGPSRMLAYLSMMSIRLLELHRVLKPTGSLYLHCDPGASHYLKIALDAVFGGENFRSEVVWKRTNAHNSAHRYGPVHDVLLYYTKSNSFCWNVQRAGYTEKYLKKFRKLDPITGKLFREVTLTGPGVVKDGDSSKTWGGWNVTAKGRHWQPASYVYTKYRERTGVELNTFPLLKRLDELDRVGLLYWPKKKGGEPCYKFFLDDAPGVVLQDLWTDIEPINSQAAERLGFPTQKPVTLMERIVLASSNEGDVVLDPFCGCGTTIHAAQRKQRRWIGMDISPDAEAHTKQRLRDEFGEIALKMYDYKVMPLDMKSARRLAEISTLQFEEWALDLVGARLPDKKAGSDKGIDGVLTFKDGVSSALKRIIFSVKSGHSKPSDVRDLRGVIEREGAAMGVLILMDDPSKQMRAEAASAGSYMAPNGERFPRLQTITVGELMDGARIKAPMQALRKGTKRAISPQREFGFMLSAHSEK